MSYYISTSTAEIAYYNDLSDAAKDAFFFKLYGKHYDEMSFDIKEMLRKSSLDVKKYIDTEDIKKQDELWHSYDKSSQYLCDQDKYMKLYK
jgi:hypothetical protein